MKCVNTVLGFVAICLFTFIMCAMWSHAAVAALRLPGVPGLPGPGGSSVESGSSGSGAASGGGGDDISMRTFKQSVTITHPTRNFRYTMPAEWRIVIQDKASDDVANVPERLPVFHKDIAMSKARCIFNITVEPMVKSFPRASAVASGLKRDKERIEIKQVVEAKRRDQGDPKKKCHFIGWYTEEAQRPDPTYNRSIFYQGYDHDNVLYVFGATCEDPMFQDCRGDFLKIMESIQFCVK